MSSTTLLGAGIGLRREFFEDLLASERRPDWLEIVSENFMGVGGRSRWALEECLGRWPVIPHGVNLNIGGPDPLDEAYLEGLSELVRRTDAPFFSDHFCYSRLGGVYLHELLPLPFNEEVIAHVVPRIRAVRDRVGRPFLLENPSYYEVMPGSTLDEAEVLTRIVEEADCGLLLDVNNVYVNAQNHGYDPVAFLDRLPLERVGYVHLAGHTPEPEAIIDTHGAAVPEPVWDLFAALLERTGPVSALVEWDHDIPPLDVVLDQADRARALLTAAAPAGAES
ncbi:MAG: DUF692 domain-containing protein [Planctomycetota bacterium]|nr:MAG: DUF692 domain-containing protein [Planctomycetota bacterium]